VGISEEDLQRIFTPFVKIQNFRHYNREGVGLGLAVSKNIALALGGDLRVESVLGKGSKFTLSIPIIKYAQSNHKYEEP
jgi:two-component system, OmpR family, phosphate regulon sensor histidine kinase PhoR